MFEPGSFGFSNILMNIERILLLYFVAYSGTPGRQSIPNAIMIGLRLIVSARVIIDNMKTANTTLQIYYEKRPDKSDIVHILLACLITEYEYIRSCVLSASS